VAEAERQQSIFAGIDGERRGRLMLTVDRLNRKYRSHTVRPLAMGCERGWEMQRGRVSPRYTTRLDEVLSVKAC
jgi:DNA polymerase V